MGNSNIIILSLTFSNDFFFFFVVLGFELGFHSWVGEAPYHLSHSTRPMILNYIQKKTSKSEFNLCQFCGHQNRL
jgi:hypothetical protein